LTRSARPGASTCASKSVILPSTVKDDDLANLYIFTTTTLQSRRYLLKLSDVKTFA
jgi:hypothetical protein